MFNAEFFLIALIFAFFVSLILFLGKRESNWSKKHCHENPISDALDKEALSPEDWGLPQASYETVEAQPVLPTRVVAKSAQGGMQLEPVAIEASASNGTHYQAISEPPQQSIKGFLQTKPSVKSRFGTRAKLRESIITMTVIGPCRALSPH